MRALILLAALLAVPAHGASEAEWTAEWCGARDLTYSGEDLRFTTQSGRYVYADCIGSDYVYEIDFATKYHEGIGQAIHYSYLSGKLAALVLIVQQESDCRYVRDAQRLVMGKRLGVTLLVAGQPCFPSAPI